MAISSEMAGFLHNKTYEEPHFVIEPNGNLREVGYTVVTIRRAGRTITGQTRFTLQGSSDGITTFSMATVVNQIHTYNKPLFKELKQHFPEEFI